MIRVSLNIKVMKLLPLLIHNFYDIRIFYIPYFSRDVKNLSNISRPIAGQELHNVNILLTHEVLIV